MKYFIYILCFVSSICSAGGDNSPAIVADNYYCEKLQEIRFIPMKSALTNDPIYNGLLVSNVRSLECLMNRLTDQGSVELSSHIPGLVNAKVGDIAYVVLSRIVELPNWMDGYRRLSPEEKLRTQLKLLEWLKENRLNLKVPKINGKCVMPKYNIDGNVCFSQIPDL